MGETGRNSGEAPVLSGLSEVAKYFNERGVRWWLMYGSLLGAVREGRFIPGSGDIDIGFYAEDVDKIENYGGIAAFFNDKPCYFNYGSEPIINVHAWQRLNESRYFCMYDFMQTELPKDIEFTTTTFEGVMCPIPANYDELLTDWYDDWRTPRKEHSRTRIYKVKQTNFDNPWQH